MSGTIQFFLTKLIILWEPGADVRATTFVLECVICLYGDCGSSAIYCGCIDDEKFDIISRVGLKRTMEFNE